jgi:hypothetical protein
VVAVIGVVVGVHGVGVVRVAMGVRRVVMLAAVLVPRAVGGRLVMGGMDRVPFGIFRRGHLDLLFFSTTAA